MDFDLDGTASDVAQRGEPRQLPSTEAAMNSTGARPLLADARNELAFKFSPKCNIAHGLIWRQVGGSVATRCGYLTGRRNSPCAGCRQSR